MEFWVGGGDGGSPLFFVPCLLWSFYRLCRRWYWCCIAPWLPSLVCFSGRLANDFPKQIVVALDNIPHAYGPYTMHDARFASGPKATHCASTTVPLCGGNVQRAHIAHIYF